MILRPLTILQNKGTGPASHLQLTTTALKVQLAESEKDQ